MSRDNNNRRIDLPTQDILTKKKKLTKTYKVIFLILFLYKIEKNKVNTYENNKVNTILNT